MSAFGGGQKKRSATIKEVLNNVGNKTSQGIQQFTKIVERVSVIDPLAHQYANQNMQNETPFSPAENSIHEASPESETFEFVPDQSPKIEEFE